MRNLDNRHIGAVAGPILDEFKASELYLQMQRSTARVDHSITSDTYGTLCLTNYNAFKVDNRKYKKLNEADKRLVDHFIEETGIKALWYQELTAYFIECYRDVFFPDNTFVNSNGNYDELSVSIAARLAHFKARIPNLQDPKCQSLDQYITDRVLAVAKSTELNCGNLQKFKDRPLTYALLQQCVAIWKHNNAYDLKLIIKLEKLIARRNPDLPLSAELTNEAITALSVTLRHLQSSVMTDSLNSIVQVLKSTTSLKLPEPIDLPDLDDSQAIDIIEAKIKNKNLRVPDHIKGNMFTILLALRHFKTELDKPDSTSKLKEHFDTNGPIYTVPMINVLVHYAQNDSPTTWDKAKDRLNTVCKTVIQGYCIAEQQGRVVDFLDKLDHTPCIEGRTRKALEWVFSLNANPTQKLHIEKFNDIMSKACNEAEQYLQSIGKSYSLSNVSHFIVKHYKGTLCLVEKNQKDDKGQTISLTEERIRSYLVEILYLEDPKLIRNQKKDIIDLFNRYDDVRLFQAALANVPLKKPGLDMLTPDGETLLIQACRENNKLEHLRALVDKGVRSELTNARGESAWTVACQSNVSEPLKILINSLPPKRQQTQAKNLLLLAYQQGNATNFATLLSKIDDLAYLNQPRQELGGMTLMAHACSQGKNDHVAALLKVLFPLLPPDPEQQQNQAENLLLLIYQQSSATNFATLLSKINDLAYLNQPRQELDGLTLMAHACLQGKQDHVTALLAKEVDQDIHHEIKKITLVNANTALERVRIENKDPTTGLLTKTTTMSLLRLAVGAGNTQLTTALLAAMEDPARLGAIKGILPYYTGTVQPNFEALEGIIDFLDNALLEAVYGEQTLLTAACLAGDVAAVNLLLKRQVNLFTANATGKTPLMIAGEEGHEEIVSVLLAKIKENEEQGLPAENQMTYLEASKGILQLAFSRDRKEIFFKLAAIIGAIEADPAFMFEFYNHHIQTIVNRGYLCDENQAQWEEAGLFRYLTPEQSKHIVQLAFDNAPKETFFKAIAMMGIVNETDPTFMFDFYDHHLQAVVERGYLRDEDDDKWEEANLFKYLATAPIKANTLLAILKNATANNQHTFASKILAILCVKSPETLEAALPELLLLAYNQKNTALFECFLKYVTDFNIPGLNVPLENGHTFLTQAYSEERVDMIALLVGNRGIDLRVTGGDHTPLEWAVKTGQLDAVKFISEQLGDPGLSKAIEESDALYIAYKQGHHRIFGTLLAHVSNHNIPGLNLPHPKLEGGTGTFADGADVEFLRTLFNKGIILSNDALIRINSPYRTLLQVRAKDAAKAKIIDVYLDPIIRTVDKMQKIDMTRNAHAKIADTNIDIDIRFLFLKLGIDLREGAEPVNYGHDNLHIVAERGGNISAEQLKKEGKLRDTVHGRTALHYAAFHQPDIFQRLVANADFLPCLTLQDHDGRTPLHYLCLRGYDQATAFNLIPNEVVLVFSADRVSQSTPLHYAAKFNRPNLLAAMLTLPQAKERVSDLDRYGSSALHYACQKNNPAMVETLVDAGANSSLRDQNGNTALHLACEAGNLQVIEKLMKFPTFLDDLFIKNSAKLSPLDMLRHSSNPSKRAIEGYLMPFYKLLEHKEKLLKNTDEVSQEKARAIGALLTGLIAVNRMEQARILRKLDLQDGTNALFKPRRTYGFFKANPCNTDTAKHVASLRQSFEIR